MPALHAQAAVDERRAADGLLAGVTNTDLLLDRGFAGAAWAVEQPARGVRVVLTPSRQERRVAVNLLYGGGFCGIARPGPIH